MLLKGNNMRNKILKPVLCLLQLFFCCNLHCQTQIDEINRITMNFYSDIFVTEEIQRFEAFFKTLPNNTEAEILRKARYAVYLSKAYEYQNRIWESEEILKNSLSELESKKAFLNDQYYEVVSSLFLHYMSINSFENAFYYATRAQSTYEKLLVFDYKYVNYLLYASVASQEMDYMFAMRYAKSGLFQAKDLYAKNPTKENEELLLSALIAVSKTSSDFNIYNNIKYTKEAIDLCEQSGRTDDMIYKGIVNHLTTLYMYIGKYEKAYAIQKSVEFDGTESSLVSFHKKLLTEYCMDSKDLINTTEEFSSIIKNYGIQKLSEMTSSEKESYWDKLYKSFRTVNMVYVKKNTHGDVIYDNVLFSKGYLLKKQRDFKKYIYSSGNNDLITLYNKVVDLQKAMNYEKNNDKRRSLFEEIEEKEKSIRRIIPESFYSYQVSWEDVKNHLKADEVAIEFFSISNIESENGLKKKGDVYCAAVLKKNYKTPHIVELFNDTILHKVNPELYYHSNDLYNLFWKPIAAEIKGCKNVYFSPEYEMNNIAIEYVKDDNGNLISSMTNYYRLSSTKELLVNENKKNISNAVLFGGLKYNMSEQKMISTEDKYSHPDITSNRNFVINTANLRAGLEYLPETKQEVDDIYKIISSHKDINVLRFTDTLGVEESFKSLDGKSVDILHIATHGYYYTDSRAKLELKKGNDYLDVQQIGEKSMLVRSGLYFSGANRVLKGKSIPQNTEDGVLTALEVSEMNLDSLNLVVMSACSSGLGEISNDGVLGLQRGFKIAGAKTIIMSLWQVDDKATKMMMVSFYKNYLSGKTKLQSLKSAQDFVKSQVGYEDPHYWAGFIMLDGLD